jgi:hypothetical protein
LCRRGVKGRRRERCPKQCVHMWVNVKTMKKKDQKKKRKCRVKPEKLNGTWKNDNSDQTSNMDKNHSQALHPIYKSRIFFVVVDLIKFIFYFLFGGILPFPILFF